MTEYRLYATSMH